MIKGRYVAKIVIDFDFDPVKSGAKITFDEMREIVVGGQLTEEIRNLCNDEICDERVCTLDVNQMYADLYEAQTGSMEQEGKR